MSTLTAVSGSHRRPYYWEEVTENWSAPRGQSNANATGLPTWAEHGLRALREGLGREPGTVPGMRYLHRVELTDAARNAEDMPRSYQAEHAALTLFGLHQHGATKPVHHPGAGLGAACRALREHQATAPLKTSGQRLTTVQERRVAVPVARRLAAAATALDLDELVHHLRGLVPMLRQAEVGLDYTRLHRDLCDWLTPHHGRVLRAWGLQYTHSPAEAAESGRNEKGVEPAFWAGFDPARPDAGAELAALRCGLGEEAGTVPAMWVCYRTTMGSELRAKGALTRDLIAEHTALALFGLHQQGRQQPMHTPHLSPGTACRLLLARNKNTDRTALERRLGVLLTSLDTGELAHHLRSLVPLLRQADVGLDYDLLRRALRNWGDPKQPEAQSRLRSAWDRDFRRTDPQT
ncbi:type I-E CRISPR-associated protein Cse2/CasB [Streptomyces sp. V3I7]|uniref:type I-E CRISPR-associated protein Cse2/CasB n=1 Tax=Streptomyces sp. V3I7 TaxID=3042278 RepID=UPI00278A868E|nr:type I-E CRISPR-associated protein Cse2/CasB [Streptomyces sp. V3I7]MDQ0988813.1 CRISPR type I-E-associated protein CasB/Cse2 [Streptomyces sp. V3I7]